MKKNFALAVIFAQTLIASSVFANTHEYLQEDVHEETMNILDIVKPMYSFAEKCEAENKVAVIGEKDSDNLVTYTTQQLIPVMALGENVTPERSIELENEMVSKKQLQCILPSTISSL